MIYTPNGPKNLYNFGDRCQIKDGMSKRRNSISYYEDWFFHRLDGPAVIWLDDSYVEKEHWYIRGVRSSKEEFLQKAIDAGDKDLIKKLLWNNY